MPDPTPKRKLGLFDATMLVMGGILGVGIFFNPAQVAALVPSEPAFLGVWIAGGLIALCGAFTFAELGGTFPRAGGWYVYLREIYGGRVSFLFAWVVLLVISTGALALIAGFCASRVGDFLPWIGARDSPSHHWFATALIIAVTALALGGVKLGATFQNACMLIKLGAVLALLAAGFFAFSADSVELAAPQVGALPADPARPLWQGMLLAMLPVLFSCGGWQMLGYVAGEVREPQRTIPRAILLGVGGVMVLYVLLNLDYLRVVGIAGMAGDPDFAPRVAERTLGALGGELIGLAMAISALGVMTVFVIASPWIYVALAREGEFFRSFARLHPKTGAPVLGLALQGVLTVFYIHFGDPDQLVNSVVFVEWIFHALVAAGLILLRLRHPELPRPFRSLAFPLFPGLYLLAAIGVVLGALWQAEARDTWTGLAVVAVGLVAYLAWRRATRPLARRPTPADGP